MELANKINLRALACLLFALIYYFLYNAGGQDAVDHNVQHIAYEFMKVGLLWALFLLISAHIVPLVIFLPVVFITGAVCRYAKTTYNAVIDSYTVPLFFGTNLREAGEFLSLKGFLMIGIALFFSFAFIVIAKKFFAKRKEDSKLTFITLLITLFALQAGHGFTYGTAPYNFFYASGEYFLNRWQVIHTTRLDISTMPATLANENDDLTIIFVMGESARGDHFGLNGYARQTTPLLSKEMHLISFPHVTSCEVLTRYSVPCIITRATAKDPFAASTETSFITIFKKLGFPAVWLNGQLMMSLLADVNIMEHSRLSNEYLTDLNMRYDGDALPFVQTMLTKYPKKLFFVVHSIGSHWVYTNRYPAAFRKWTPVCKEYSTSITGSTQITQMKRCPHNALVNSYDNSILYTDDFLHKTISLVKHRNALVIYTSDHGESLGENGHFLHGQEADRWIPEQRNVPLMFWASDIFIKKNPERYKALIANSRKPASHDNLFHSTLDCAGIDSSVIDKSLSLCRISKK
ncbi:MAG: sulfatase-like hydrolase/transferase [Rickettsiales bacterium]